jgi:hypothetical protein
MKERWRAPRPVRVENIFVPIFFMPIFSMPRSHDWTADLQNQLRTFFTIHPTPMRVS